MEKKIKINLTPHDALAIASFLREFINDSTKDKPKFQAINKAVENYENEVCKMSKEDLEDGIAESRVNELLGKCPKSHKGC